jgi:hypothetical protein
LRTPLVTPVIRDPFSPPPQRGEKVPKADEGGAQRECHWKPAERRIELRMHAL